jgi:class 3 adenylate cyclase
LDGDGINIAARIEALADAGAVFISYTVYCCHLQGSVSLAPLIAGGTPTRSNRAAVGPGA